VLKRVESRERERAKLQRELKPQESYGEQRQIDGLRESLDLIHRVMEGMTPVASEPAYP
jgi:hypothetical protein